MRRSSPRRNTPLYCSTVTSRNKRSRTSATSYRSPPSRVICSISKLPSKCVKISSISMRLWNWLSKRTNINCSWRYLSRIRRIAIGLWIISRIKWRWRRKRNIWLSSGRSSWSLGPRRLLNLSSWWWGLTLSARSSGAEKETIFWLPMSGQSLNNSILVLTSFTVCPSLLSRSPMSTSGFS